MIDTKLELETSFSNYIYDDLFHTYQYLPEKTKLLSVTQFLKSLTPAFNTEFWSVLKAFEYSGYNIVEKNLKEGYFVTDDGECILVGWVDFDKYSLKVTPDNIKNEWKIKNTIGISRGTHLHNYLEQLDNRDYTTRSITKDCDHQTISMLQLAHQYPRIMEEYSGNETPESSFQTIKKLARKFKDETSHLIPIVSEYVIGDKKLGLAGRLDRIYYNKLSEQYELWDFKTDKKIEYKNIYRKKFKLFNIDDCEFNKYSLQTSLYKYIIEKNSYITLGQSYIVHFDHNNNVYSIIKAEDFTELIKEKSNEYDWSTYIKH